MSRALDLASSFAVSVARGGSGMAVGNLGARPERLLELYEFEACPFCRKVREGLSILDLDAMVYPCPKGGQRFRPLVERRGGKAQFPWLVDPNAGVETYESDDILRHLFTRYGDGQVPWSLALAPLVMASSAVASLCRPLSGVRVRPSRAPAKPLELWSFEASPYCRLVRDALCTLEVPYILHNVAKGSPRRDAFVARSGKMQVPYLHDPNTGRSLFESADIVAYLDTTYALETLARDQAATAARRQPGERMSALPRLQRLLAADGKCFDVAIDHGIFNEPTFLPGIEDMPTVVRTIAAASPDAIQLTPGQAPLLQRLPGRKPALVLRIDVANVYGPNPPDELFCALADGGVEAAVRLDAACVVLFLLLIPGEPDLHRECVENLCRVRSDCEQFGMPLMVEPIAMKPDGKGGYTVDGDVVRVSTLVRQAVELGADVIKADPTDDLGDFGRVVQIAGGKPVLVRGGGKASEEEIFARTEQLMRAGAAGIVYGRNVIQHTDPNAITRAFMAVVHDGASAAQAMQILRAG